MNNLYALIIPGEGYKELIGGFWPLQYCMDMASEFAMGVCVSPEVLVLLNG